MKKIEMRRSPAAWKGVIKGKKTKRLLQKVRETSTTLHRGKGSRRKEDGKKTRARLTLGEIVGGRTKQQKKGG